MADVGFSRSVQGLTQATNLAQLRDRLSDCLAGLGFWGVGESIHPPRITHQDDHENVRFVWDNFANRVGARRHDLKLAYREVRLAQDPAEENYRLKWLVQQKSPYLAIRDAPVQFPLHQQRCQVVEDFGLRTTDLFVVPRAAGQEGAHLLWAMAEAPGALVNREAAGGLLAVYTYMCRMFELKDEPDQTVGSSVQLTDKEQEVLRWAAAGKTIQDIADITGVSYRTVRFHMDRARSRYGFATTQQTIVRAALDYQFDPLGPSRDFER